MNSRDFRKLIGATESHQEYIPVACLLSSRYGCVGYYNGQINEGLDDTCVLLNARLVELDPNEHSSTRVSDFNDFIEDVVTTHYGQSGKDALQENELRSIPLTAVPFNEIALVYPVAHIAELLKLAKPDDAGDDDAHIPTFLDFDNRSVVMKVLRTKLW